MQEKWCLMSELVIPTVQYGITWTLIPTKLAKKQNWFKFQNPISLVTRRGTLLMETGLLHDYFGNFSMRGERYYFT